jgi:hypothetical protein
MKKFVLPEVAAQMTKVESFQRGLVLVCYPMWDCSSIPKVQTEDEPSEVNEVDCGISTVRDCVGEPGQGFLEGCFDSFDGARE